MPLNFRIVYFKFKKTAYINVTSYLGLMYLFNQAYNDILTRWFKSILLIKIKNKRKLKTTIIHLICFKKEYKIKIQRFLYLHHTPEHSPKLFNEIDRLDVIKKRNFRKLILSDGLKVTKPPYDIINWKKIIN